MKTSIPLWTLRSGDNFWLLSPNNRNSSGNVNAFNVNTSGNLSYYYVSNTYGVRPSISLKPGSMAVSGSGTAADPWIVDTSVSPNPYCTDASTCMQNTTNPPACGTTMTDGRDGATYTTATIAGTCWMTQNLDHDIKTDGSVAYTPATTDVPATWIPSTATYPTGTTTWNESYIAPESYDPGELYWNGIIDNEWHGTAALCTTAGGTWDSVNEVCNFISSTGNSHYHLGNYYNWTAAVAMNDSSSYETQYQDVDQSICPANWTLPKNGDVATSGSFLYLAILYGWDNSSYLMENPNIWDGPIKASPSGYWDGYQVDVGNYGSFWSPIVYESESSYGFGVDAAGYVNPIEDFIRWRGWSVRCLAR